MGTGYKVRVPTHARRARYTHVMAFTHTIGINQFNKPNSIMIDEYTIHRVKDAASIVDVIADFYELRKRGSDYECKCPFHDDRHLGSFRISPIKNIAKCFSCGWQGGPVDFLMDHEHLSFVDAIRWLGKKYSIEVEGAEDFEVKPSQPRAQLPELPMLILPDWMWQIKLASEEDTLVRWLNSLNWDKCQRERINEALEDYCIGTSKNGMTIFWQIDEQQRVRTGKMMLYKSNGHREKETSYNFDWVHSALFRDYRTGYSADKTEVKTCLFGLHLLDKFKRPDTAQDVCIVESEKTALIMAIAYGNYAKQVWMACGGIGNINREKLKPLIDQHRNIILYPDRDGVAEWKAKAELLHYDHVIVETKPVLSWWKPGDGEKADIADVVVRMIQEHKEYKRVEDFLKDVPKMKILQEKLQLELAHETE